MANLAKVIRWPRHKLHRCSDPDCYPCQGGLAMCVVCKGAEADLPTDCPGRPMTEAERHEISNGCLDYRRRDGWVKVVPKRRTDEDGGAA